MLDSKKSYVRYVSHELRTPIAVALMGVNIAKLDLHEIYKIPEDSAVTQTLMDVEVACSSAVDILNDMLSFDKLESGVMMVHKSMVRVEPFIASCVKLYSSQCRQKNIHLIIQYDIDKQLKKRGAISIVAEDEVECDKSKVEQVIRNLVANAIAYSSAGSTVTIRVFYLPPNSKRRFSLSSRSALASLSPGPGSGSGSGPGHRSQSPSVNSSFRNNNINGAHSPAPMNTELKEESVYSGESIFELDEDADQQNAVGGDVKKMLEGYGRLVIECVDHGVGISRKNQAKLFNGVVQFAAEKLQANGGTGYGMYISKGIAELHGGKLSVYSRGVGHGSTFTLRLPMLRSAEAQASENKLTDKPASIRMTDTNLGFTDCDAFSLKSIPAGSDIGSISTRTAMLSKQQSSTRTFEYYNTDDMVDQKLGTLMQMNEDSPRSSFKNTGSTMKLFSSLIGLSPDELHDSALDTNCTVELVVSDPGASIASTATDSNAALTGSAPGFASALRTMSSKSASVHSASSAESKQSEPSLPPPTYKLLAVDDSRVIRRLIIKTMVSKGHTCDEAEDGIDGVNKIKAQLESGGVTYDAILMDFVMPNMDGPTATKEIRDLGVTIPILGLTGNCLPRDVEWFMECGATAVMFKPLNVKEFDDHMNTYVNRK